MKQSTSPEFLIEGILPANEPHLLGGSSGSGKTTFTFQWLLNQWQDGNPFFGHQSNPVPYSYISLDRSRSSVTRTLQRLNLEKSITRVICQEDVPEDCVTVTQVVKEAKRIHPDSQLLIIEGFQLLVGDKGNHYTPVANLLKRTSRICTTQGLTILGICHSPKMKNDESYQHPRESIMGSAAWGAYSDTVMTLSLDEATGTITTRILPRNGAMETHSLVFGVNGTLVPLDAAKPREAIKLRIESLSAGSAVMRVEILRWAEGYGVSAKTADRVITGCLKNKVLEAIEPGIYERSLRVPLTIVEDFAVSDDL